MPARLPLSVFLFALLRISSTPALVECIHAAPLNPDPEIRAEADVTGNHVMAEPHRGKLKLRGGRGERRWRYAEGRIATTVSAPGG